MIELLDHQLQVPPPEPMLRGRGEALLRLPGGFIVDARKGQRTVGDARHKNVQRLAELLPEARTPRLVPLEDFQCLVPGLRPEDDSSSHV